ncbi:MAG: alpha/beta hydrolase [Anaerolineae bacterium]|nr:alpha/beta hydrolase [Anaerolineae bacterium]
MKHTTGTIQSTDGMKLFTQRWDSETDARAVIILVHGLGEHSSRYQHVAQYFTQHGMTMLAFDLRGHGNTPGARGHAVSFMQILDDIQCMIDLAKRDFAAKPVFLYGHSMGGNLVLYYYQKRRPTNLAGIIASSPGLAPAQLVPDWKMTLAKVLYNLLPAFSMNNGLDLSGLSKDDQILKAVREDRLYHTQVSARLGLDIIRSGQELLAKPMHFDIPLLLQQGSADRVINPQATIQFAKNAAGMVTFKLWEDMYHELHNEPEKIQVLDFVRTWIEEQIHNL